MDDKYQTRSEENGLEYHPTLEAAHKAARKDPTIWKISYAVQNGDRIRLVRKNNDQWVNEPITV